MTWTYHGVPGTNDQYQRRDAVRMLVGDTDTSDQQSSDEEIAFALSQTSDDVYGAAVIICRALAAKYSRLVDTSFEGVRSSYSQRAKSYHELAIRIERQGKKTGGAGLGGVDAGGISKDNMDTVDRIEDRLEPAFKVKQFENPSRFTGDSDPY